MFKGFGIVCAASLMLAGCGIVGGTNNSGGGSNGFAGQAQGVYSGTTSSGYSFESIVLPNDQFYEIYGTLVGNPYSISGMVTGQGVSGNDTYTATNVNELLYTGQVLADSLSATDVSGSSLGGALIPIGKLSGVSFTGVAPPASSFNYGAPASLADISRGWTGTQLDGTFTTVTIDSSGTVTGSSSGCPFSGMAAADSSHKNFFDVTLKFGDSPCVLPNLTASGVAVDSLLSDGVTHQLWIVVTEGATAGTAFLLQSPASGGATLSELNGQYSFSLAGSDSTGNPMSIAGSINADGLGHITGGEVDLNDNGTIISNNTLVGTYAFDSNIAPGPAAAYTFNANPQGTLGTIALTYTVGTVSHPLAFAFSLQSGGGFGQIMSLDVNNFIAAGAMGLQSSSAFTLSSLAGDYVVALAGTSASNPTAVVGRISLGAGGTSTNVSFDRSVAGVGTAGPTTGAALAFGSAGPDANGRGTLSLTLHDALADTTQEFAYYVIGPNRIVAMEIDGNGTMAADFSRQSTPFTAASVVTTGSVFGMSGVDEAAAGNEIAAVGQMQVTGVGTNTGTVRWDSNDSGVIVGPASFASQAVPVFDQSTGRGMVKIAGGAANGLADSLVFYLTAPGTGFILDATAGVNNRAMAGALTAQGGAPYSAANDLGALGIVRTKGRSTNDAISMVGLFGLTTSPGTYALAYDQRSPKSSVVQTQLDDSAVNIMVQGPDENTGRGTLSIPSGSKATTQAFYVVGPNQFVYIDVSPVSSGLNSPSSLHYVDPH